MLNLFRRFKANKPSQMPETNQELLSRKYGHFRALLSANNRALELIADLEDKATGEYLFDRAYLEKATDSLSGQILKIIDELDALSGGAYKALYERHRIICEELKNILYKGFVIPVSPLTVPLEQIDSNSLYVAGGKLSHLGEIRSKLGCPVPEGFVITSYAFKRFMEHNNLTEKIHSALASLQIDSLEDLKQTSLQIQELVLNADIPPEVFREVAEAVRELCIKIRGKHQRAISCEEPFTDITFSVRSSAIFEDSDFSFAGQYATYLNVTQPYIIQRYKGVLASLFTPNAVFYHKTKGFSESDLVMSVGVIEMIDARSGGVIYTRNPNDPKDDTLLINAVYGLGKAVVDGTYEPHTYRYSKSQLRVVQRREARQDMMLLCSPYGDIIEVKVPEELTAIPCLSDEEVASLVRYALALEDYYGGPQDIEWVIDKNNNIYILQTRPLKILSPTLTEAQIPRIVEGYNILIDKGVIACRGVGYGSAHVLKSDEELEDIPAGVVLVVRHPSTRLAVLMKKLSAIVADVGGVTGHMASIAREYKVPTIVDAEVATRIIKDGQEVTVDAYNCNVYEGKVQELLDAAAAIKDEGFKETRIFGTLLSLLKWISPLNLTDPESDDFRAEMCNTFHDITRFAHEMSMREMFETGLNYEHSGSAMRLKVSIPTEVLILDIGGGVGKTLQWVEYSDVLSIPFKALLSGMLKMRWPDPPKADARGFLGMIARTATISEEQITEAAKQSFAIVSANYMNFSIRLGYHFSLVEAFIGVNINDNYIKFFFKGGGAAIDRRLRRVDLITRILKKMDFNVTVTNDVINATLSDFKREYLEDRLEVIGKLTAYTKQLDMTLYNDAITTMFAEQFMKEHMRQYL